MNKKVLRIPPSITSLQAHRWPPSSKGDKWAGRAERQARKAALSRGWYRNVGRWTGSGWDVFVYSRLPFTLILISNPGKYSVSIELLDLSWIEGDLIASPVGPLDFM